jgi:hypothetical protein
MYVKRCLVLAFASFGLICLSSCNGFSYRAATTGTPELTVNSASVAFGDVKVNSESTQSLVLTSSGSAPVTIATATTSGTGFSQSGVQFPITLFPNQTATLNLVFQPLKAQTATGSLSLQSNSSAGGTTTVSLSGTGVSALYQVNLNWNAPAGSKVAIEGYNIYRAVSGSSMYQLLNPSVDMGTTYMDSTVQDGTNYDYYVETVDTLGASSVPSDVLTISIP